MSTVLSLRYDQDKLHATMMKKKKKRRGQRKYMSDHEFTPHQNILETAQRQYVKQIVNQNFGKSINNRTYNNNAARMTLFSQSSRQVRYIKMRSMFIIRFYNSKYLLLEIWMKYIRVH
jgi:hypothetical protein